VYQFARIGRPNGGVLLLSQAMVSTPFHLPGDLPDEDD
jgi:hypothetical protein